MASLQAKGFTGMAGHDQTEWERMRVGLVREWHHPSLKAAMAAHYNELTRVNRDVHRLNFPPTPTRMGTDTASVGGTARTGASSRIGGSRRPGTARPSTTLPAARRRVLASLHSFPDGQRVVEHFWRVLRGLGVAPQDIDRGLLEASVRLQRSREMGEIELVLDL
jgi:hypothetical protein